MAESAGDKTEAPTPRRRTEARQQGNIARSHDLTSSVLLLGGLMLMKWFGPRVMSTLRDVVAQMLSGSSMSDFETHRIGEQVMHSLGAGRPGAFAAARRGDVHRDRRQSRPGRIQFQPATAGDQFCGAQSGPRVQQDSRVRAGLAAIAAEPAQGCARRARGLVGRRQPARPDHRRPAAFVSPDIRFRRGRDLFHRHPRRRAAADPGDHRLRLPALPGRADAAHDQVRSEGRNAAAWKAIR